MNALETNSIFCVWSGENSMSPERQRCLSTLQLASECNVILVSPKNIHNFIDKDRQIHSLYPKLSLTHRSDYLQAYLLYHYGGGYSGIKPFGHSWRQSFERLKSSEYSFTGSREMSPDHIASDNQEIKNAYRKLISMQRLIFKPKSKFALMWLDEVEKEIEKNAEALNKQDGTYHPRAIYGGAHDDDSIKTYDYHYPFIWNQLCGKIFHKLCYENIGEFSYDIPEHYPFPREAYR